ncbi:MAG: ComF family protein [Planctomycetota bacterium]|nr:MAG: ComF family protein [Planctomycetota bacterium]
MTGPRASDGELGGAIPAPQEPFVWPPRERPATASRPAAASSAGVGAAPRSATGLLATGRQGLESLERTLLPWVSAPLAWRLATGRVVLDEPDAACDRCGRTLQKGEDREFGCVACESERFPWVRLVRLGEYRDGLAEAVREVKFRRNRALGEALGRQLGEALRRAGVSTQPAAITPLPTTRWRRLSLGIDHALTLARGAARAARLPLKNALARRPGPTQLEVPPSARRSNVAGAFYARHRQARALPKRVVLVDDVLTTGSTLRAASKALRRAAPGVELWAAVAAVAQQRG